MINHKIKSVSKLNHWKQNKKYKHKTEQDPKKMKKYEWMMWGGN